MDETAGKGIGDPFEEQQKVQELLTHETRHLILQTILGHSDHLMSEKELDSLISKSQAPIRDHLEALQEAGILDTYEYEPNTSARDLPEQFWGPTERGIEILFEHNFLRGVPVARAVYDEMDKSEELLRHADAPRPSLPDAVREALDFDEPESADAP